MPTPFETEISALLRDMKNPRLVADELVQRWRHRILSEPEQIDCAQFLLAAGLYPVLFEQIEYLASDRAKLPWAQFVEVLGRTGVKPDEFEWRSLIEGAEAQEGGVVELFKSPYLDLLDGTEKVLIQKREVLRESRRRIFEEKKSELKDKMIFMRNNRLFDQEKEVLEELAALFPDELEFVKERESLQLRWAREIIANAAPESELASDLHWKLETLSPELTDVKNLIVARAHELAKEKPFLAYDLAVALHAMDLHNDAIDVLAYGIHKPAADWLKLELMIFARQFVNALDHASRLEISYASDPDAAFAVIYARARALNGLGQASMAVDLLRSLVRIRPHYKSAQSLLMDWSDGEN